MDWPTPWLIRLRRRLIQGNGHSRKVMAQLYLLSSSTSTSLSPLGFLSGSTNVFNGTTLVSTCVIKLQSEDRLLIHSNIAQNPGMDDILVSINSTTSINYSSIAWDCPAPEFYSHRLSSQNNNVYSFSLTDENGELIQLNGLNLNLTLLLYKKDAIFDQLRSLMKMLVSK